jgi:hypothetical protein
MELCLDVSELKANANSHGLFLRLPCDVLLVITRKTLGDQHFPFRPFLAWPKMRTTHTRHPKERRISRLTLS